MENEGDYPEVDRAFAAAIAEANALAESAAGCGFGENFDIEEGEEEQMPTARIAPVPEAAEDEEGVDEEDDDF